MPGKVGRPEGSTKFDAWARLAFLRELADTGRFYDSAEAAGVAYTTMKKYREGGEREDPDFEEQVQEALECYRDKLRREVHRRGVDGWVERGLFGKDGRRLGDVVKFSDRLLELDIKRNDPSYREKVDVRADVTSDNVNRNTHAVDLEQTLRGMSREARAALRTVLKELVPEAPALPAVTNQAAAPAEVG